MSNALNDIDEFFNYVNDATDIGDVFARLRQEIDHFEFEYFTYELVWPFDGPRQIFFNSNYRPSWLKRYSEEKYEIHDIICRHAAQTMLPFRWSEICNSRHLTETQRRIINEGGEAGIKSGATIPLHGPGTAQGYLTVASNAPEEEFSKLFQSRQHQVLLLATYVHERIVKLKNQISNKPTAQLTPHEIETLCWTARGKTAEEVACIMGGTASTVNEHIKRICKKLNVHSKVHAVSVAMANRLIIV